MRNHIETFMIFQIHNSPYASDLTPRPPFPERAGGVTEKLPSPFRGGAGGGVLRKVSY